MTEKLRVGIIGCGAGRFHTARYERDPRVKMVAIAGLDEDRCIALASKHNIPRRYRDYTELLAQDDIEAVSLCVPNYLHASMAIDALQAGKHVLVEKPLATTIEEGEAMARAAAEAGKVLMPVFNYRYRKDSQIFKQYIAEGNLGQIYYANVGWLRQQGIPAGEGSWFIDKPRSGGGCLIDLGVHMLDLSLWLLGNPRVLSVSATTTGALGPQGLGGFPGRHVGDSLKNFNVEDFVAAFLRLETGAVLNLTVSWAGYTHWGDDFFVHLWGDKGGGEMTVFRYDSKDTLRFFNDMHGSRTEIRPQTEGDSGVDINQQFVTAILEQRPVSPTVEEGVAALRVIDAIYRSAEEKREIIIG